MLQDSLRLYKYPVLFVAFSFWLGIYLSPFGLYAFIGFIFALMLFKYVFGADTVFLLLFFVTGLLYPAQIKNTGIPTGRIAVRATVVKKGVLKVDSVIGMPENKIEGRKIYIRGLSGLERGDMVEALIYTEKKNGRIIVNIIKIRKLGTKSSMVYAVNRYLKEKIEELSDREDIKGFMLGVLIGYRDFIPHDVMDIFKKTGTMHILALSGLHIGILVMFLYVVFIVFLGHRDRAYIASLLFVFIYMLVVGVSPSIFRAFLIFTLFVFIRFLKHKTSSFNALGLAGMLTLLFFPSWAFSYGFMLSYLAVFGILYYTSSFRTKNHIVSLLVASLGAVVFTLPITSNLAGYIPVLSFLFNIVIIPLFTIVLWMFFILLGLYILFPPLLPVYMFCANLTGGVFLKILKLFSSVSVTLKANFADMGIIILYYLVILVIPVIITILKNRFLANKEVLSESS